ncbi:MAG: hypothetical protein WCX64_00295 [Candidatus Micrarchaeia archaeon]
MAPLNEAIVGFPVGNVEREEVFQHRKYSAVVSHPLEKGSKVIISSEFKPSGVAGTGAPFRTRIEGVLKKGLYHQLTLEEIARLRKIHKPSGSRVVPFFDGKNINGPFKGAYIVKPVTAAQETRILRAMYEAGQKR